MVTRYLGNGPRLDTKAAQLLALLGKDPAQDVRLDTIRRTQDAVDGRTPALKGAIHPGGPLVVVPRES